MLWQLFLLVVFSAVLALSTNLVIRSIKKISRQTGVGHFALASSILAFGTSLPELVIAIQAGLAGESVLVLGSILGSNVADLSIIIGGASIIGGAVKVSQKIIHSNVYYTFLLAAAPLVLLIDGKLTRIDGLLLLALFAINQAITLNGEKTKKKGKLLYVRVKKKKSKGQRNHLFWNAVSLIAGFTGVIFSAKMIVAGAQILAASFKVPPLVVGIFIIGLGSSLPELILEIKAIRSKETELALGDLLGSLIINSSLIMGIATLINPITLVNPHVYLTTTLFFLMTFLIFYLFIRSKAVLERWEGAVLLMFYFLLLTFEFL